MNGLTYAYNSTGRLGQVKQGATSLGIYRYNHRGERVLRQAGGKTTTTLYDESGQWLGEYGANGVPLQQVVWLENYPIAVFSESSAGVPALGYVQPDHLGAPRVIIDATRNVPVWEWALTGEAFGADAANEDPDGDGVAFGFALRFPGQQATPESGLNYNYQRDYDAGVGRYAQSDPIGLAGGNSTFGYVNGRPLTASDPFGLVEWSGVVRSGTISSGVGGSIVRMTLTSECIGGSQATAEVTAVGMALGPSIKGAPPLGVVQSTITLNDRMTYIDPGVLNGWFSMWSAGVALGRGYGVSMMQVGGSGMSLGPAHRAGASTLFSHGQSKGFEVSLGGVAGSSTVTSSSLGECGCAK